MKGHGERKDREGREGGPSISIMPLGSELERWPDSLSTGAQSLGGDLGSETGQREQRGSQWKKEEIFWLKSLRGKKNAFLLADGRSSPSSDFLSITSSIYSNLHIQGG